VIFLNCMQECPFKDLLVKELKLFHVQAWLDKMGTERGRIVAGRGGKSVGRVKKWGDTMKRMAFDKLLTALNWAVSQGLIPRNPLVQNKEGGRATKIKEALGLKGRKSRGRDYVLASAEHEKLLTVAKPFFADLLRFLDGTGCRPGEAYNATAKHYVPDEHAIIYRRDAEPPDYVHKTARRTDRDRLILLTPELEETIKRLTVKYPDGPLLRNRDAKPWTNSSVYLMLKRLRKRLGLPGNRGAAPTHP
jgi:integrase